MLSRNYGDCLDSDEGGCEGETFERPSLSGSDMAFPRCEKHYQEYADRIAPKIAATRRRYPDSSTPPEWFDESCAGERWDDYQTDPAPHAEPPGALFREPGGSACAGTR